jgi:hypothetical protein
MPPWPHLHVFFTRQPSLPSIVSYPITFPHKSLLLLTTFVRAWRTQTWTTRQSCEFVSSSSGHDSSSLSHPISSLLSSVCFSFPSPSPSSLLLVSLSVSGSPLLALVCLERYPRPFTTDLGADLYHHHYRCIGLNDSCGRIKSKFSLLSLLPFEHLEFGWRGHSHSSTLSRASALYTIAGPNRTESKSRTRVREIRLQTQSSAKTTLNPTTSHDLHWSRWRRRPIFLPVQWTSPTDFWSGSGSKSVLNLTAATLVCRMSSHAVQNVNH